MKGLLIAGTHSGCGKTTVTLAIMSALVKMGYKVQSFKAGPDFIDTGLHKFATGIASRNLDIFMCGEDYVSDCFNRHSLTADISIIEGVMGLYDGDYSTYKLARTLNVPIILVVDVSGMAESIEALISGFLHYDTEGLIRGIIFNKVGSERHLQRLLKVRIDKPVLGYIQRESLIEIPRRHLGLTVFEEGPLSKDALDKLSNDTIRTVDINQLISLVEIPSDKEPTMEEKKSSNELFRGLPHRPNIAIAYDKAFCFYYEDNLDYFRDMGGRIITFSPLNDSNLPEADLVYIGGGYPELYARQLSENKSMVKDIKDWSISEMPLYAECGGMMYLSKGIYDLEDNFFEMAGVFELKTKMRHRLSRLGYRYIDVEQDNILCQKKVRFKGHEYHYSHILYRGNVNNIFKVTDSEGNQTDTEGYLYKNTLCSYIHIHFGSYDNSRLSGTISNHK